MADVDRKWLGEGIFGGYEQDLKSQMRNLGLGLTIDSAAAEGQRLDEALASIALAGQFGVSPNAMMGGFVGGVDIPGMRYGTQEREAGQDFAANEALLGRNWQSAENVLNRDFTTDERLAGQTFTSGQNILDRAVQERAIAEQRRQFNQNVRSDAAANIRAVNERAEDVAYRDAVLAAEAEKALQTQENWQTEFDANMLGVDTREWISEMSPTGNVQRVRNPTYGMTPTEAADYAMDLIAASQTTPEEPRVRPEDWLFREMLYTTAGDDVLAGQLSRAVKDRIGANENVIGGGLSENNVLWALSTLAGEGGEYAPAFSAVYNALLNMSRMTDYGVNWE